MIFHLNEILNKKYPQNFLIKKPMLGTLVFLICIFAFVVIYQPLNVRSARSFCFDFTMLLYCLIISTAVFALILILRRFRFFIESEVWTFPKELLFDLIILIGICISTYFAGFVIEEPASRWNFYTFSDSVQRAFFLGIVPVFLFTLLNLRYLFTSEVFQTYAPVVALEKEEVLINIVSKAKKENLSFYPSQFIYAESRGNYVVFHLQVEDLQVEEKLREVIIRNSIGEIEQQFAEIPYFMRIHRAFIVNLKKVESKNGNALGYQLKLAGCPNIISVSRQNAQKFDRLIEQNQ